MEVVTFSVLSAFVVQILCLVSYICYKRYKAAPVNAVRTEEQIGTEKEKPKKPKQDVKKQKNKQKSVSKVKRKAPEQTEHSDTESFTTEDQLAQIIMQEHHTQFKINTTAVNEKPTVKKHLVVKNTKSNSKPKNNIESVVEDKSWEVVTDKKHKMKIHVTNPSENVYKFTLNEDGGVVETPFCEIHFPGESVTRPLDVRMEIQKYQKIVDETGDKFLLTPAFLFATLGNPQLQRRFTLKMNTMKIMGRGWDAGVSGQIETSCCGEEWVSFGRAEYQFGKPIQIVHDRLTNFRIVITRGQNGVINRRLNVAGYISKPKVRDPDFHIVHLCVYDQTPQSSYRVESSMQKNILKMNPRECDVPFGSDLHFQIQPNQKFTTEEKDVFIRWTEICKTNVFVKFQIRLTKNPVEDANYESEFRTLIYLSISKVNGGQRSIQEEYFPFYWVSANSKRNQGPLHVEGSKVNEEKSSEDDGFASGTEQVSDVEKPIKLDVRIESLFKKPFRPYVTGGFSVPWPPRGKKDKKKKDTKTKANVANSKGDAGLKTGSKPSQPQVSSVPPQKEKPQARKGDKIGTKASEKSKVPNSAVQTKKPLAKPGFTTKENRPQPPRKEKDTGPSQTAAKKTHAKPGFTLKENHPQVPRKEKDTGPSQTATKKPVAKPGFTTKENRPQLQRKEKDTGPKSVPETSKLAPKDLNLKEKSPKPTQNRPGTTGNRKPAPRGKPPKIVSQTFERSQNDPKSPPKKDFQPKKSTVNHQNASNPAKTTDKENKVQYDRSATVKEKQHRDQEAKEPKTRDNSNKRSTHRKVQPRNHQEPTKEPLPPRERAPAKPVENGRATETKTSDKSSLRSTSQRKEGAGNHAEPTKRPPFPKEKPHPPAQMGDGPQVNGPTKLPQTSEPPKERRPRNNRRYRKGFEAKIDSSKPQN